MSDDKTKAPLTDAQLDEASGGRIGDRKIERGPRSKHKWTVKCTKCGLLLDEGEFAICPHCGGTDMCRVQWD
ncbi:MAG: hypothetical protein ACOYJB_09750 [Christensenellaceae bacterium]|jgi:hypothetical protein